MMSGEHKSKKILSLMVEADPVPGARCKKQRSRGEVVCP
jgi:hypothetical protein